MCECGAISFSTFNCHRSFHSTALNWKTTQGILGRINRFWKSSFLESKELNQCGNNFHCNAQSIKKVPSYANYCRTFCNVLLSGKSKNCAIFISCRRMKIISLCSQANYCSCDNFNQHGRKNFVLWLTIIKREENTRGSVVDKT